MLDNALRDAPLVPAMDSALDAFGRRMEALQAALMRGRRERGCGRRRVAAAVGHATAFPAWRSLVREQELDNADAVDLMAAMIRAADTT
jgi:hypothetical protein